MYVYPPSKLVIILTGNLTHLLGQRDRWVRLDRGGHRSGNGPASAPCEHEEGDSGKDCHTVCIGIHIHIHMLRVIYV